MSRSWKGLAGSVLFVAAGASGASAQNINNETWLGQVGGTNTIVVNQSGRNNQAGGDNVGLRVDQDGDRNLLDIDQYGHRNRVGASGLAGGPTGIKQIGAGNSAAIDQSTSATAFSGGNVIDAIRQESPREREATANILSIAQDGDGGIDGAGGHRVRTVSQHHSGAAGGPNSASVLQIGGGLEEGNHLGDLRQHGTANSFELAQENQLNRVMDVRQIGTANKATVGQGLFAGIVGGNLLEFLLQEGAGNISEVKMSGAGNVVQRIEQNNSLQGDGTRGNSIRITLEGDGNGSNGNGQVGYFLSEAARAVSAGQADLVQIGENNRMTITITGIDNRFGAQQLGEDNDVVLSIGALDGRAATSNESAVFQDGTDNSVSHVVLGSGNVGAVQQWGDFNRVEMEQRGEGNLAAAMITGNGNNLEGVAGSFTGLARSLFSSLTDIRPGQLFQDGLGNEIRVTVDGASNSFGLHQHGNLNRAESTIIGSSNQVVVAQLGNDNIAITRQQGIGNMTVIRQ